MSALSLPRPNPPFLIAKDTISKRQLCSRRYRRFPTKRPSPRTKRRFCLRQRRDPRPNPKRHLRRCPNFAGHPIPDQTSPILQSGSRFRCSHCTRTRTCTCCASRSAEACARCAPRSAETRARCAPRSTEARTCCTPRSTEARTVGCGFSCSPGKKLYMANACWTCHGNDGQGNGPVAAGLAVKPANFVLGNYNYGGNLGEI